MRLLASSALAFSAFALAASSAMAAPASVHVGVAPELQAKFDKTYGAREGRELADDLRTSVERALGRTGAYADARIELTLTDVKPNRPTMKQMSTTPGLSLQSFGLGGATVAGQIVSADGRATPVSYRWYESDLREASHQAVWGDATWAFDRFARKLAQGEDVARR
jgi:hypothetical protein